MKAGQWAPAIVLGIGAVLATVGVRAQSSMDLRAPLAETVADTVEGFVGRDMQLTREEIDVVGVSSYLSRVFQRPDTAAAGPTVFMLYVGYYDRQTRGKTIHSPRNCLPGGGWEPLTNQVSTIQTDAGPVQVNRYLLQNGQHQALVLYWYQGRGRIAHNEYLVKWDLLRDAAIRRRSEEALVRIVVPIRGSEAEAFALASRFASQAVASVRTALPT